MLIEIFSDFVCPWCYLGVWRLERALAQRPLVNAQMVWRPFQLNPEVPPEGLERSVHLANKFGSRERARQMHALVEDAAKADGVPIRLGQITRTPNTILAHRLMIFATREGAADAVAKRLFSAYFVDGLDLGSLEVLVGLARDLGLDEGKTRRYLSSRQGHGALRSAEAFARRLDLHAVPCFLFDKQYALAGAQDPVSFLPLLDLAQAEVAEPALCST